MSENEATPSLTKGERKLVRQVTRFDSDFVRTSSQIKQLANFQADLQAVWEQPEWVMQFARGNLLDSIFPVKAAVDFVAASAPHKTMLAQFRDFTALQLDPMIAQLNLARMVTPAWMTSDMIRFANAYVAEAAKQVPTHPFDDRYDAGPVANDDSLEDVNAWIGIQLDRLATLMRLDRSVVGARFADGITIAVIIIPGSVEDTRRNALRCLFAMLYVVWTVPPQKP